MNSNKQIFYLINRIWLSIKKAIPKALKTAKWLIKLTIPVTFTVFILNYSGILAKIAILFAPLFKFIGLPGESALVFISGVFANLYSVIALLGTLDITYRQGIILAVMSLISHGFIIETAILKSTGSSAIRMVLLRLTMSFVAAWLLNMLLPAFNTKMPSMLLHVQAGFWIALKYWFIDTLYLIGKILLIITALMIIQQILEEFGALKTISKILIPVLKPMGLPESTTFSFIVAYVIGLAYGSAIMKEQMEKQEFDKKGADLLNHHIAVSHSHLEDTILFIALGLPAFWIIWPRIALAILVVWLRKAELKYQNYKIMKQAIAN